MGTPAMRSMVYGYYLLYNMGTDNDTFEGCSIISAPKFCSRPIRAMIWGCRYWRKHVCILVKYLAACCAR